MLGKWASRNTRFPLLLKFLDVAKSLSVQVHPPDGRVDLIPFGETGKTEAWVVLKEGGEGRIYAGLKPGATEGTLREAITKGTLTNDISSFAPKPGDGILVRAGTVHSLRDVVVFEVQENSDVTFRLFDWNHVDPKTGKERPLQVEQALACIDFAQGVLGPLPPDVDEMTPVLRERLFHCSHFGVSRIQGDSAFMFGAAGSARIFVCTEGEGWLNHGGELYPFRRGDVVLLPAIVGACSCEPKGAVTVLDVTIPELAQ
jgi:mannose-6-phosphate isomerase